MDLHPVDPSAHQELLHARSEILALLSEFTFRIDHGISVGDLFDEDAILVTPRGEVRGRQVIAELFASLHAQRAAESHRSRHGNLDVRIGKVSEGRFEVHCLLMAFSLPASSAGSLLIGDQVDVVRRDDDGIYRFMKRALHPTLQYSLVPASPP